MKNVRVALLRGINVGSNKRVAMADLRQIAEGLGCTEVRTLLNSGNVVFCSALTPSAIAEGLEKALKTRTGVSARIIVLTGRELLDVAAANPLLEIADNASRLLVNVLSSKDDRKRLVEIAARDWGAERIALTPSGNGAGGAARAFYMWMPRGIIQSKLNQAVGKALKDEVTARNWATILKLKEMVEETPEER